MRTIWEFLRQSSWIILTPDGWVVLLLFFAFVTMSDG